LHIIRPPEDRLNVHRGVGPKPGVRGVELSVGPKFQQSMILPLVAGHHSVQEFLERLRLHRKANQKEKYNLAAFQQCSHRFKTGHPGELCT
jgi:hypothetical protein